MQIALKEAVENRFSNFEQMRKIANAYTNKCKCSVQEAVYHIAPDLWLRKVFPGVLFANSNLPDKRFKVCLSQEEIEVLSPDSTDVFKRNMLD